jgi:UDP-N-acetylglucosamine--N-acetylmuramyl-(pentapeptide) pyrophosphoryl-undecaprenol N-acetylglucosamine transferase
MPAAHVWFMRLLYSCSELGLGHASRTIALGKRLEQNGHEVHFYSGGKAYQLLKKEFKNVYPCTPVAWYENARGIDTVASLVNILFPLPIFNHEKSAFEIKSSNALETTHRYYDLRRHIKTSKPDLIVADGDMHALRLAHRWKFPAVYITNLIRPSYGFSPFLNPGERLTERYVKQCAKIIIPDVPPPYTVCEHNLSSLNKMGLGDKVTFTGGFLDMTPVQGREEHVFASVSGPFGTRAQLTQMILPVLKALKVKSVLSLGLPGEKKTVKIGNCVVHTWLSRQERQECMRNARLIIFSGGHITCLETIKYAKPSVCVPTQPEQLGNAVKLQNLGCSVLARSSKQLKLAVEKVEAERQRFKSKTEALNRFAVKFNGLDHAVEVIENTVK